MNIAKWDFYEARFEGPSSGNPFMDVELSARFMCGNRHLIAEGFYDGDGRYVVRIMPDQEGEWRYEISSNVPELDGVTGAFTCVAAREGVHGPIVVDDVPHKPVPILDGVRATRFAYADGAPYLPVGTTCYVWNHQGEVLERQTLETLAASPFNKIRFCVFPKHYVFNSNEPELFPLVGSLEDGFDFDRFNPAFFRHLEQRVGELRDLGIEADLILLHPYDHWGFSKMPRERDIRYLRYVVARLSGYRNIWWSFANEFDLMPSKTMADWDEYFRVVMACDPANHLRSIHHCVQMYDHTKPWVTHVSIQYGDLRRVSGWIEQYQKPVVVDECGYEGDISFPWGSLTAQEMVHRMWVGFSRGGYVGHGETYLADDDVLWWSKGGVLKGESVRRIAFLREVFESIPGRAQAGTSEYGAFGELRTGDEFFLYYYGVNQHRIKELKLPEGNQYRAEVIDTWDCSVTPIDGTFSGECTVHMPGKPYCALRLTKV